MTYNEEHHSELVAQLIGEGCSESYAKAYEDGFNECFQEQEARTDRLVKHFHQEIAALKQRIAELETA